MKVFQKKWVKLVLLLAFCGTLIAAVYLDMVTLWSKEVRFEEQSGGGPYRDSLIFKGVAAERDSYAIEGFCKLVEAQAQLQGKTIRIEEYGFNEGSEAPVHTGGTEMTWEELLKSQGMEGMKLLDAVDRELEEIIISQGGAISEKSDFICISGRDFVKLLDTCPDEQIYSEEGMNKFSADFATITMEDVMEEESGEFEYNGEYFDSSQDAYWAYTEGRLEALLNRSLNFDWDWKDSFVENLAYLRLYESGDSFLLYDEKEGVLVGNRMQYTSLSEIERSSSIYLMLKKQITTGSEEIDWPGVLANGFTSSLASQLYYEVYLGVGEWSDYIHHGYLKAVEIYKDGELFINSGETGEEDVCVSLVSKEELAYVFGKNSDVYKNEYDIYLYYSEYYFDSPENILYEFLYEDCLMHGDRTNLAVAASVAVFILGILVLAAFVPSLWNREEKKLRDRVLIEVNILFTIAVTTVCCMAIYGIGALLAEVFIRYFNTGGVLLGGALLIELFGVIGIAALFQLVSTVVYRIRKRCFLRSWLAGRFIYWIYLKLKRVAQNMDILKRRVLILAVIGIVTFIGMVILCACAVSQYPVEIVGVLGMFWYIACLTGFAYMFLKDAMDNKRLLDGCNQMKDGMFDKKIEIGNLYFDKLELAEAINTMGEGLEKAVSTSMKDERMKAELITNVSHDIKTPLTSIINYIDLLKREGITPEEQQEYLKVLDTKSQRLKQLIEDLIEVSKTNTGNIELQLANLDFKELLNQAIGEFEEKFAERNLELVVTCADHKIQIWADGRRCYRILENLFSNIYKYAMPHTRVYVDLQQEAGQMVFTLKNISEAPLNVAVEELMERFVRGDVSRSTSGSGLGLSIAQNLVNLQQGKLEIKLDGDLFKVEIRFPVVP